MKNTSVPYSENPFASKSMNRKWNLVTSNLRNPPRAVLEEQLSISDCWKFAGPQGHVTIALLNPIYLGNVTIHFPNIQETSEETRRQVPKDPVIWALAMTDDVEAKNHGLLVQWERFIVVVQLLDSKIFSFSASRPDQLPTFQRNASDVFHSDFGPDVCSLS
ncbi:hypothetical protein BDP27DRAFT_1370267 [Rhodocollybia butyracea]|uniref:SUN domain-containing protein n=1 Tax=Rhodocollybia butyracea TaxID=206335 RepID=A0A9P5PEM7_9AGAR|nr:hypothetical protein BDP27DRAFT_1370267 [Rhodocollybia butyracea]